MHTNPKTTQINGSKEEGYVVVCHLEESWVEPIPKRGTEENQPSQIVHDATPAHYPTLYQLGSGGRIG